MKKLRGVAITSPSPCSFSKSTAGNNGNVYQIVNNRGGYSGRSEVFTYDVLNRIASAQSTGTYWGETFTIDAWGNLTNETGIAGKTYNEGLNTSALGSNQLSGYTYDAAGNMANNGGTAYKYDAENRLVTTAGYNYYYDGDGQRVAKVNGSAGTLYWRGPTGDAIFESSLTGTNQEEYIFFNGSRLARRDVAGSAVHYYFSDHLGSHGVVENAAGTSCEQDIDYYPFGGVMSDFCPVNPQHYRFTGKERDTESGLDYFGARYDASSLGRFMTPDWATKPTSVPYAKFGDPQTLNLYSYVENGPLNRIDADGHTITGAVAQAVQACANGVAAACNAGDPDKQAQSASTMPLAPPAPIVLPALGEAEKDLIGGLIQTLAVPLILLDYLVSPGTTATEDKDTIHGPPPSTSQQGAVNISPIESRRPSGDVRSKADAAAMGADGKLHCAYCGGVLTSESGKSNSREYDHVNPYSRSKDSSGGNIKDACRTCNRQKGGRTPEEWGGPQQ